MTPISVIQTEGQPMTPTDMIQCLRDAQALLRRDGWVQGDWGPASPERQEPRCMVGAVRSATGGQYNAEAIDAIKALAVTVPIVKNMEVWNDAPGRSEDEVHDLLDRTIQRLETE